MATPKEQIIELIEKRQIEFQKQLATSNGFLNAPKIRIRISELMKIKSLIEKI